MIEQFLLEMLSTESDITLRRNELASQFSCAPSQINYVIDTRFTGQRGYIVESQRGGGGYIRIRRVTIDKSNYLMHVVNTIGESISFSSIQVLLKNMVDAGVVSAREMRLFCVALNDRSLGPNTPEKDCMRAEIFKNMLVSLI